MSRRFLNIGIRILSVGAISAIALTVSANADSWTSASTGPGSAGYINPVLPDLSGDVSGATTVVLPQMDAPVAIKVVTTPGENPFATLPPIASPAPTTSGQANNPFTPVVSATPGASINPAAKPLAITAPAAATAPSQADPTDPAAKPVDETALRYYAAQRDLPRVGAETRRLKALNPGWEPPADLFTPSSTVSEQPLWDLFASGQYAMERAKIEEIKAANPSWAPSSDLVAKLQDAEAREAIRIAYNAANWNQVVAAGQSRNSVLVCTNIETLWQLGEAFSRMRNYAQSFDVYKYILTNCADSGERLATMQKASLMLPQAGIDSLVLLGHPMPDGTSEFDSIGFNNLRTRMTAAITADMNADPVGPNEIEHFAAYVRATRQPSDIGLIGWYYYHLEEYRAAYAWFTVGARTSRDPKFLEGQVLALRGGEQTEDALKLASAVQARSPELSKEYVELVAAILTDPDATTTFTDDQMKTFQGIVAKTKSALGAQAVGWTYVASNDLASASLWFNDSMSWGVTEGGVIGQAVVASRLKQYGTLSVLKAQYTSKYPGLAKFKIYKVKVKKSKYSKAKTVTQSKVDCGDRGLGAFFTLSCKS